MARHWFITGAASGIGAALAQAAVASGDVVVGTMRQTDQVASFGRSAPARAHGLLLDVDDFAAIGSAVAEACSRVGHIDIVVNNAGRSLFGAVEETGLDEAAALLHTNLLAPLAVIKAFLPHFRLRVGGLFINMSSGCGLFGTPAVGVYSATKFALEGLSEALATETAGFGVKVMLVEPGAVATRFISHGTQETAQRLPEYATLSGHGKAALDAYYTGIAASAETVAKAILEAIKGDDVPLRLPLSSAVSDGLRFKGEAFVALAG
jgi:short-subunit dehydrogenase